MDQEIFGEELTNDYRDGFQDGYSSCEADYEIAMQDLMARINELQGILYAVLQSEN